MEKWSISSTITQIRSNVNFGNNLGGARAKKVRFYFVTLKWHRSTCYINWAILIGDPADVTTLLLLYMGRVCYMPCLLWVELTRYPGKASISVGFSVQMNIF